jgi:branched-chain amino acid aminotransferase
MGVEGKIKSEQGAAMNSPGSRTAVTGGTAHIDDQFVPISEARIPILDWGFLHSDATYDVVHVWQGSFFRLDDHLDRFTRGMERLHMRLPYNRERIREILFECVRLSGLQNAYVEMICTRGIPAPGSRDPRQCTNRFYAFAVPFVWIANPEKQKDGLHLIISQVQRIPDVSIDPTIKNYHWLDLVAGLFEAYSRGGETAILSDREGNVIEGPGFNIFVLRQGKLATPVRGVLEGITRKTVIEMGQMLNIPVETRVVSAEEIRQADEVFITSTAGGIMPVTKVDGHLLGDGKPGPITLQFHKQYWSLHQDPQYASPIQYVS